MIVFFTKNIHEDNISYVRILIDTFKEAMGEKDVKGEFMVKLNSAYFVSKMKYGYRVNPYEGKKFKSYKSLQHCL